MKDTLREMAIGSAFVQLRRCEWCDHAAIRGGELCTSCLCRHVEAVHRMGFNLEWNR